MQHVHGVEVNKKWLLSASYGIKSNYISGEIDAKLMGFFSNIIGAAVKTALTPVALVKDVVNVATGQDAEATSELIDGAVEDVSEALDDLADGEL